jgi:hypothetical protein
MVVNDYPDDPVIRWFVVSIDHPLIVHPIIDVVS